MLHALLSSRMVKYFAFWTGIRFRKKQKVGRNYWHFCCRTLFCISGFSFCHERSARTVLNTFSDGTEEHRNDCVESDQKPIKPSFLPTVANSRCLNKKKGTTAWYVPALFQPPALLFCKETFGSGFRRKEETSRLSIWRVFTVTK